MGLHRIALGGGDRLAQLFSYPNTTKSKETLADTVLYWFAQTLANDGITTGQARASIEVSATKDYTLVLDGDDTLAPSFALYGERLPRFLDNGWNALTTVVPTLERDGKWDPIAKLSPPSTYRPWKFFLPLGMAMVNQRSVQFFHYPPIRLLEQTRNYLDDPVPARVFELLEANGVPASDLALYNTVVDGAPIAAEDNQGSMKQYHGKDVGDPTLGLIPINYFGVYQKAQVELLLNPARGKSEYTVPIVVYGDHPRQIFAKLFNVNLGKPLVPGHYQFVPAAAVVEIIPGRKTPVVSANHPYNFYAEAQGFDTVGSGRYLSADRCRNATNIMRGDLAITRWQKLMADDPSQPPQDLLDGCMSYWNDPARAGEVRALARHQASLFYSDPVSLAFTYNVLHPDAADFSRNANNPGAGVTP